MSKKLLRIPFLRKGEFHNERHGRIAFDGEFFGTLVKNFEEKRKGYEPYARYGHNAKGIGIWAGEEAVGHCVRIEEEDEQLVGYFEPTSEKVVDEVNRGAYRYSSAEIITNAKDPNTGEAIGPVFKGVGLTNEPSIPGLHRTSIVDSSKVSLVLADDAEIVYTVQPIAGEPMPSDREPQQPASEAPKAQEPAAAAPADTSSITEALKAGFAAVKDELKNIFAKAAPVVEPAAQEPAKAEEPAPAKEEPKQEKPAEAGAPSATKTPAPDPEEDEMAKEIAEQLAALQTQMKAMGEAQTAALEAVKAEAAAVKEAAEAAAESAKAEAAAAKAEAAAIKAAAEGKQLELALADRAQELVLSGTPPMLANKAANIVRALKAAGQGALQLGDGSNLEDEVWALADAAGTVTYGSVGKVDSNEAPKVSQGAQDFLANIRAKKA